MIVHSRHAILFRCWLPPANDWHLPLRPSRTRRTSLSGGIILIFIFTSVDPSMDWPVSPQVSWRIPDFKGGAIFAHISTQVGWHTKKVICEKCGALDWQAKSVSVVTYLDACQKSVGMLRSKPSWVSVCVQARVGTFESLATCLAWQAYISAGCLHSSYITVGPDIPELTISSYRIRWSASCFSDICLIVNSVFLLRINLKSRK